MKKSLLVLTAALSFGMAAAQTAAPASAPQVPNLTDVPAGHWAKDAIDKLVSRGIILGYPDGTFRGTQNLTRYEAAVIIARLLDEIRSGQVVVTQPGETPPPTGPSIDEETLLALQNAIQELAADLAALGVRVSDLEENAVNRDDFTRLEERVELIAAATGDTEAIAGIQGQIDELTARADEYDTMRADVDDNASSIAALNDLTVLLNQDILNLQDRTSAIEAAQADLVARADFDTLSGRVGVVETKVTGLDNRVTQLEKYAFSIKPTLTATYYVARSARNMDLDRLIPGTMFTTGDDGDGDTADTPVDWADLTGGDVKVVNDAANYYGFSTATGGVNVEGATTLSLSIDFANSGKFGTSTSQTTGALVKSAGGLNVNTVDLSFGIRAGLPSDAADDAGYSNYPDVVDDENGITYRPLFFYFKNATAQFTVGNAPVTVTLGKAMKFKFGDYLFDNDKTARGDGYMVNIDGSTLPVIGAFKPTIQTVYGSRYGKDADNVYYRGVRATITPVGTLKAGIHYAQEGYDGAGRAIRQGRAVSTNAAVTDYKDVTAFGADLHGTVGGWQVDSEYAQSRLTASTFAATTGTESANVVTTERAFYGKVAGSLGPVKVYNLNYRTISAGYNKVAGIMEANPLDTDNGSTAPYSANQQGFGVKVGAALGPVAIGGYWDNQVAYGSTRSPFRTNADDTAIVDRGITAKVSLLNLITVRGGYYEYLKSANAWDRVNAVDGAGRRYGVRADITPGLGFGIGAYYRNLTINTVKAQDDANLFRNSRYNSYFELGANNELKDQDGCGDLHPGIKSTDVDGVGRALTFTQNSFGDTKCYSEYGVELLHNGKDANALVKDLSFRLGYAGRYRNATNTYRNTFIYGDVLYGKKVGIAQVDLKGAFGVDRYADAERNARGNTAANSVAAAIGLKVVTDQLNTVFKPSFEGQVGYYTRSYDYGAYVDTTDTDGDGNTTETIANAADYTANGLKYLVGVKLNEFLLPNTKLAVYYSGYRGQNRSYEPFVTDTAGYFKDQNTGATVSQDLLYVEANYYDMAFGYGVSNLKLRSAANNATQVQPDVRGQVFKIQYKVNF